MRNRFRLKPEQLRQSCKTKQFGFRNTSRLTPLDAVIGQQRAVQAIDFGLNMMSPGYNIFVTGIEGTGKSTIVRDLAGRFALSRETPGDWCMVNNFRDEYCPKAISLPSGQAGIFARRMNRFVEELQKELPAAIQGERYQKKLQSLREKFSGRQQKVLEEVERFASRRDILLNMDESGIGATPMIDGKPLDPEAFSEIPEAEQRKIENNLSQLQPEIEKAGRDIALLSESLHQEIEKLLDRESSGVVDRLLGPLKKYHSKNPEVLLHLDEIREDIIENVQEFLPDSGSKDASESAAEGHRKQSFQRYRVNVLADRSGEAGAPVIFETNPTYSNVFGQIEKRIFMGSATTDFTMVQAGSMLKANGGYLIMEVESVLANNFVWDAMKRALQNKMLQIEDLTGEIGFGTASLRPGPIPLNVKIILLGDYETFEMLQNFDLKFNKLFKVRADFDHEVKRTPETILQYAAFIARVCREEGLLPFTSKGVAAVVEYGSKYVSDQQKLSLRFGPIVGILQEAEYWARKTNSRQVGEKHVIHAFKEHRFRYNLYEEKLHDAYVDGTLLIDVQGDVTGQVNALAVYQLGDFSFGRPSRLTAEVFMGKPGIVDIEREAGLSGSTHDKGVLILSGYLGRIFAQAHPLGLSISITFEQSYGEIDGDSASSTELYAILSSLSGIPIHQGVAVTGSVNQKGEVQAIGGVNQKIEGFYEVCTTKGLTGKQGVLIPRSNIGSLMLNREVVAAVRKRRFNIYAVSSIEEGIEILTGIPAGKPDRDGRYPAGTVYGEAQLKIEQYMKRRYRLKKLFESGAIDDLESHPEI